MTVDQVVSVASDCGVLLGLDGHEKITRKLVIRLVTFANEAKNGTRLHSWLDLDLFVNYSLFLSHTITLSSRAFESYHLGAAVIEFEERARPNDFEIGGVGVYALSHSFFMKVALDSLNHFNLLARFVKCDSMRVRGTKENLEHLKWVTVESVTRDLVVTICANTNKS